VLKDVLARGPVNVTEFSTVSASESMNCEISPTFTSGRLPAASRGKSSENDVYLQIQGKSFHEFFFAKNYKGLSFRGCTSIQGH
jgi:hypothetical protein